MMMDWVESLKAGDKVFVVTSAAGKSTRLSKVDRVTKTQVIVGGQKFRRKDGTSISRSTWTWVSLAEVNNESMCDYMRSRAEERVKMSLSRLHDNRNHMSREQLEKVGDALSVLDSGFWEELLGEKL